MTDRDAGVLQGSLAYWLLAGCGPFDAPRPAERLAARLEGGVRSLSSRGRPVSSALESTILGCLAREPGDCLAGAATICRAVQSGDWRRVAYLPRLATWTDMASSWVSVWENQNPSLASQGPADHTRMGSGSPLPPYPLRE